MKKKDVKSHAGGYLIGDDFVQTDWDFPRAARDLGWSLTRVQRRGRKVLHLARRGKGCDHAGTDGTVKCPDCGIVASDFITAASQFLDRLAGYA